MDELPDKIIPFTRLVINRDKTKKCRCRNRHFIVDDENHEVECKECGAIVPAYEAISEMAHHYGKITQEINDLLEQRKRILDWKPWLLPLREAEKIYRGGEFIPGCPHCGRGIEAKELTGRPVSRKLEMKRREAEKEATDRG